MLEINPEIVCLVIVRAREFQAKEEVVLPDVPDNPSEDWALQVLADHIDDLSLQEARSLLDDLEPDQQEQLVALMWIGRGDFEQEEWEEALDQAQEVPYGHIADYLFTVPMVADYLLEGLERFGYDCDEI